MHFRHPRHATNEHQLVDVAFGNLRIFQARFDRRKVRWNKSSRKLLELRAGQFLLDVLRPARVRRDERQIDLVFLRARQRDLGFLSFFLDALDRVRLFASDRCRCPF